MNEIAGTETSPTSELDFLMEAFVSSVPHARAVQLASGDGLKLAGYGLDKDQADYLSAIIAHHLPMFDKNLRKVTRSSKTVHEDTVITAGDTVAVIASAGQNALLCALADREADIGVVGFEVGELVRRVGKHLGVDTRGTGGSHAANPLG